MNRTVRILGAGGLLLAVLVTGCLTTTPTGQGKLCIDVSGQRAGDEAVATVYIDGVKECDVSMIKGKGFFLFSPAGKHVIKIEAEGFETYEKEVSVRRNETTWMDIRLKRPEAE